MSEPATILGIESSCDDTAAAVVKNGKLLSSVIAGQKVHEQYGGVVPELASRAHQKNIIPVVEAALKEAGIARSELSAIAFTRGPGLLGSLMVGTSFSKGMAMGLDIPLIEVNHMQAHILAHFIRKEGDKGNLPSFPFLCLTVSGGHTQLVRVNDYFEMEELGRSLDDAAGETFDKAAKVLGLSYPGGPLVEAHAKKGNPLAYKLTHPSVKGLDFSFSGLKTAFLYLIRDELKKDPEFIEANLHDLCASIQHTIVQILMNKLKQAAEATGISEVALAGGVSANSELRKTLTKTGEELAWNTYIPELAYCTDNAAMIATTGYLKYLNKSFAGQESAPSARMPL